MKQYRQFESEILQAIKRVFNSGRYILAEECASFESEFASYCKARFAIAVASGTEALYLSLKALNIGDGDEVITSTFTPIPTVSAIIAAGAKPVLVDINKDDFLMDLNQLKDAMSFRTKAIIPVHLFGDIMNMNMLLGIAHKHRLFVVEDACQAHGSAYKGKKAGSFGELGCFSFYPTKNIGGYGDGGMVITDNLKLEKRLKLLRDYGKDSPFTAILPGINSRLDEIQAAVLRVKLQYLDKFNEKRRKLARIYCTRLKNTPLKLPIPGKDIYHNYHVFAIGCGSERDKLMSYLKENKIQTNIYYPIGIHLQKAYRYLGYKRGDFPACEKACKEVLALPIYPELELKTVEMISNKIIGFFNKE